MFSLGSKNVTVNDDISGLDLYRGTVMCLMVIPLYCDKPKYLQKTNVEVDGNSIWHAV